MTKFELAFQVLGESPITKVFYLVSKEHHPIAVFESLEDAEFFIEKQEIDSIKCEKFTISKIDFYPADEITNVLTDIKHNLTKKALSCCHPVNKGVKYKCAKCGKEF